MTGNSYGSLGWLDGLRVHRLNAVPGSEVLPLSHKILLENLLRHEDVHAVTASDIETLVRGEKGVASFSPSRVFLHDTNGVPVLTDLAALRDAVARQGGDPAAVRPRVPAHLTVDHSIATEVSARPDALRHNVDIEYGRNAERFRFLKWGERLGLRVVPPGTGIMHQINLEYLASVVERRDGWAFPDTCAGTDSHTTMVNALGVLAWGVGGVEAEAALLGQPVSLVVPAVVGVELTGEFGPSVTATDLVLTIVETLRAHGVVGKFVEFTGLAVAGLPLAHRATIANMCPEFGATAAMFPIDDATLAYLRLTGREPEHVRFVEKYAKEQGLWPDGTVLRYDEHLKIDLSMVTASLAGPRRPQDRVPLGEVPANARAAIGSITDGRIPDGAVAIAAITSCTNTSNPHVMVAAGLLARNARARGLTVKPWVKTSLAPGSKTVTEYLHRAGLSRPLNELGFQLVGYGCMTCIGNSGPLLSGVAESGAVVASVLSGNRNFDGRVNNDVGLNYLASPPLVVAYALAGTVTHDLTSEPLGHDNGEPVFLADLWPDDAEIDTVVTAHLTPELFRDAYADPFGDERWAEVPAAEGDQFAWESGSTYLRRPPFLDKTAEPGDITGARVLLLLGDSVTTDHISPAGRIPPTSCAGRYLLDQGETDLNTYASRRGNFEVMVRGGFGNPRLDIRGGLTRNGLPAFEAAQSAAAPLLVIAGREYGTGSSRDWAAKATALLGVRAVLAESFERIHRANLVQLGVLPLQFADGDSAESLGLAGTEEFDLVGVLDAVDDPSRPVTVRVRPTGLEFEVRARLDTPLEATHYRHGGVLPYILSRFGKDVSL
ncbi:aconitate hydratase AcnA [Kutzneria sp. CA-103260]|uniref:aconitate hydratase AcnA n=1 Tax=Kutzneria sp. CA-103260 TaxID=2802641 RepID=UPI001BA7F3AB|nr:aconitate hydratase AcnA [Kutzneria sp. CA-103260]QUQ72453.1 aconitate hydratase AcnA [Kutzneria sp. CA-103260]